MSLHRGVQSACTTPPVACHSTGTSSSTSDSISSRCSDYKQLGRLPAIAAPRFPACTAWRFESSQADPYSYAPMELDAVHHKGRFTKGRNNKKGKALKCYACGKLGHMAKDCHSKNKVH